MAFDNAECILRRRSYAEPYVGFDTYSSSNVLQLFSKGYASRNLSSVTSPLDFVGAGRSQIMELPSSAGSPSADSSKSWRRTVRAGAVRSEEHTSELQS